jgi:hypothetical protein
MNLSDGQWVSLIVLVAMGAVVLYARWEIRHAMWVDEDEQPIYDPTPIATEAMAVVLRRREIQAELSAADERRGL